MVFEIMQRNSEIKKRGRVGEFEEFAEAVHASMQTYLDKYPQKTSDHSGQERARNIQLYISILEQTVALTPQQKYVLLLNHLYVEPNHAQFVQVLRNGGSLMFAWDRRGELTGMLEQHLTVEFRLTGRVFVQRMDVAIAFHDALVKECESESLTGDTQNNLLENLKPFWCKMIDDFPSRGYTENVRFYKNTLKKVIQGCPSTGELYKIVVNIFGRLFVDIGKPFSIRAQVAMLVRSIVDNTDFSQGEALTIKKLFTADDFDLTRLFFLSEYEDTLVHPLHDFTTPDVSSNPCGAAATEGVEGAKREQLSQSSARKRTRPVIESTLCFDDFAASVTVSMLYYLDLRAGSSQARQATARKILAYISFLEDVSYSDTEKRVLLRDMLSAEANKIEQQEGKKGKLVELLKEHIDKEVIVECEAVTSIVHGAATDSFQSFLRKSIDELPFDESECDELKRKLTACTTSDDFYTFIIETCAVGFQYRGEQQYVFMLRDDYETTRRILGGVGNIGTDRKVLFNTSSESMRKRFAYANLAKEIIHHIQFTRVQLHQIKIFFKSVRPELHAVFADVRALPEVDSDETSTASSVAEQLESFPGGGEFVTETATMVTWDEVRARSHPLAVPVQKRPPISDGDEEVSVRHHV